MKYAPTQPPADLLTELRRLQQALQELEADLIALQAPRAAPARPRDGMIAFADGVAWNPGSGIGLYVYHSGTWNFIA